MIPSTKEKSYSIKTNQLADQTIIGMKSEDACTEEVSVNNW